MIYNNAVLLFLKVLFLVDAAENLLFSFKPKFMNVFQSDGPRDCVVCTQRI